jgi:hypothetical protein
MNCLTKTTRLTRMTDLMMMEECSHRRRLRRCLIRESACIFSRAILRTGRSRGERPLYPVNCHVFHLAWMEHRELPPASPRPCTLRRCHRGATIGVGKQGYTSVHLPYRLLLWVLLIVVLPSYQYSFAQEILFAKSVSSLTSPV